MSIQSNNQAITQHQHLIEIIKKIHEVVELEAILTTATKETRKLLKCDRLAVYRFNADYSGEFVAESVSKGWRSLLPTPTKHSYNNNTVKDSPINILDNLELSDSYLKETQAAIFNPKDLFRVCDDVDQGGFSQCYRQLLERYQARAYIIVAVYKNKSLWGLFAAYQNDSPRHWETTDINFMVQVGVNLGIALQQWDLLAKTQQQQQRQTTLNCHRLADLNTIIDNLGDGLLVVDISGKITHYNPKLVSMFSVTPSLLGKQVLDIFPPELSLLLERKELDQKKVVTIEIPLANNGIGQALASSIIKEQGKAKDEDLGVVILIRDITKEREIERMKHDFLSMVSHELRTPLTSIVGFSSLIRDKLSSVIFPELETEDKEINKTLNRIQQNLDIVVSEGERLTQLINDFLDMTKIESGKITLHLLPIKPSTVLSWAIASTAHLFEASSVELIEKFSEDLPYILGDEDRLIQVFVNLISNGFKFTETGCVMCHAEADHNHVLISITDTGIGIAEDNHSKVFEPFQQVSNILTNKPKGTGLGLSISKQIIEQHGGKIWFTSELGKGSTFFVSLPLAK
ncbi:MAG: ATP-binding protein [Crocosphaera sp.]|nr:ATP-binding protein [Crocosphaera sp.]